jgi:hypothetical protein
MGDDLPAIHHVQGKARVGLKVDHPTSATILRQLWKQTTLLYKQIALAARRMNRTEDRVVSS